MIGSEAQAASLHGGAAQTTAIGMRSRVAIAQLVERVPRVSAGPFGPHAIERAGERQGAARPDVERRVVVQDDRGTWIRTAFTRPPTL